MPDFLQLVPLSGCNQDHVGNLTRLTSEGVSVSCHTILQYDKTSETGALEMYKTSTYDCNKVTQYDDSLVLCNENRLVFLSFLWSLWLREYLEYSASFTDVSLGPPKLIEILFTFALLNMTFFSTKYHFEITKLLCRTILHIIRHISRWSNGKCWNWSHGD